MFFMSKSCLLCDNINPEVRDRTFIKRFEYWTVLASFKQPTLGSSLIVLNRHAENISDLTPEEDLNYTQVLHRVDDATKKAFDHDMANDLLLCNTVRHIHHHFIPRYADKREFAGKTWIDKDYGTMTKLKIDEELWPSHTTIYDIVDKLGKYL